MLFAANFTKLADDQFLTALAWVIAGLRDAEDFECLAAESFPPCARARGS